MNIYKLWLPRNMSLATAQVMITPAVVTLLHFTSLGFYCVFDEDIPRLRDHYHFGGYLQCTESENCATFHTLKVKMWFRFGNPFTYALTNAKMVKSSNVLPSGLLFACTFPSLFFVHSQNLPTFINFFFFF